jgi:AcrR family transcriptional regulator
MKGVKGSDELTAKLVDEGARLLVEEGPAGLSLRKVAAAAGVSTMPVYTLFGDKQGLLTAMHREGFRRLGEAMRAEPAGDDPAEYLGRLGLVYRTAALASPNLYDLMFGHEVAGVQPDADGTAAADAAYRPLVDAVARCQDAGLLIDGDPEPMALYLWAVAHGMVSLELNGKLPEPEAAEGRYAEALAYSIMPFLRRD